MILHDFFRQVMNSHAVWPYAKVFRLQGAEKGDENWRGRGARWNSEGFMVQCGGPK